MAIKFFLEIEAFVKKLFATGNVVLKDAVEVLIEVGPYVNWAYPIVQEIAVLTPNRTVQEIINAYKTLGFPELFDPSVPKETSLHDLAVKVLNTTHPTPLASYLANLVIEAAYAAYKKDVAKTGATGVTG